MGPWLPGRAAHRRGLLSVPCWRTSFFTMRSISGCNGNIPPSRSNATLTTRSAIARTKPQALELRQALEQRFAACCLRLHPEKTKIVYCKDANRPGEYPERSFDFLGYTFRSRTAIGLNRKRFVSFIPAVSDKAAKRIRLEVRRWRIHLRSDLELDEIARWTRPFLSGWVRYYGRFYPSKLREELRTIDAFIVRWVSRKYKRFRGHTLAAWDWLRSLKRRNPTMFAHWTLESAVG